MTLSLSDGGEASLQPASATSSVLAGPSLTTAGLSGPTLAGFTLAGIAP
jgi:hypothetical protein